MSSMTCRVLAATCSDGNFKCVISIDIIETDIIVISCQMSFSWMPQDHIDAKSILVYVIAWCLMVPDHYLNQIWPSSMLYD